MQADGKTIDPVIHCDVMGTLWNRDRSEINSKLLSVLQALKDSGRTIKIITNNPPMAKDYIGDFELVTGRCGNYR